MAKNKLASRVRDKETRRERQENKGRTENERERYTLLREESPEP